MLFSVLTLLDRSASYGVSWIKVRSTRWCSVISEEGCLVFQDCYFLLARSLTVYSSRDEIPTGIEGFVFMYRGTEAWGHNVLLRVGLRRTGCLHIAS